MLSFECGTVVKHFLMFALACFFFTKSRKTRNWDHRPQQEGYAIGIRDRMLDVCNMIAVLEISK